MASWNDREVMSARRLRVAIDGPAGAGKSTVARGLAQRLGYVLLDTGALYRAIALATHRAGLSVEDVDAVASLAEMLVLDEAIGVEPSDSVPTSMAPSPPAPPSRSSGSVPPALGGSGMRIYLRGEDVSALIRAPEMSLGASRVSAVPAVRTALLAMQRRIGAGGGVVIEGRDIGTVVFPDAEAKFFLTASPEERARRRFEELAHSGVASTFGATLRDVIERDRADTERPIAPLRQAHDAVLVDSAGRKPSDIIEEMAGVVLSRAARR